VSKKIRMQVNAFFGDDEIELSFPENWDVHECLMAGHNRPPLSDEDIRKAIRAPLGTPRLSEMARGHKEVCIVFDDLPKPTPASRIVPFVLEELHEAGISDDQIRFVCGPGTHRPLIAPEFEAKLGREIVERFPVYNHSIWENVVSVGKTSRGTPVQVNREFASCDLKLAIGSIFPHGQAGFGGGGKIILPGICGIETIDYHHKNMRENASLGRIDGNVFRLDIEEAARLAGLQFKVDAVINNRREVVGLFAGDFVDEHRAGVELARGLYKTNMTGDADVLVLNSYPDEGQIVRATWCAPAALHEGGDVVLLTHSHEGQNLHQWSSRFGKSYGGRGYVPGSRYRNLGKAGHITVLAPNLSRYDLEEVGPPGKVVWCRQWADVLADLASRHGPSTRVVVYPYAPLQMPA